MYIGRTVACAGFISAGAEKKFRGAEKKLGGGGGRIAPEWHEELIGRI